MRKKNLALLLATLMLFAGCSADQTASKLDKVFADVSNFHGSVLIAKNGVVLLDKGYGMADKENGVKCATDTKYPIGSNTKQFTAMAVMQLYSQGKLDIDDKLSKYVPDFSRGDRITLRNLLNHTSGIIDYANDARDIMSTLPDDQLTEEGVIRAMKDKPAFSDIGTFRYSNTNYLLLGYIVEKVSGLTYGDYLQKNIFDPLGMKNTGVMGTGGQKGYTAVGYNAGTGYVPTYDQDGNYTYLGQTVSQAKGDKIAFGGGCLYSTTGDIYLWARALSTEKLLPQKYMDMITASPVAVASGTTYGFGWYLNNDPDLGKCIWHGGQVFGYTASIYRYPDQNITVVYLTNINLNYDPKASGNVYSLNSSVNRILAGK